MPMSEDGPRRVLFPVAFVVAVVVVAVVVSGTGDRIVRVLREWARKLSHWGLSADRSNGYELVSAHDLSTDSVDLIDKQFHSVAWSNTLRFSINGEQMTIVNPHPQQLLANYLRETLSLKGTKLGCEEGGCGACTVVLTNPLTSGVKAVNSCLRLLCGNDGLAVTTVEGVGSIENGLSCEQKSIVQHGATQCGYCTPGWVTAMHALRESGKATNDAAIDAALDGNICRCTGYRPILKAFHSLADENASLKQICSHRHTENDPSACLQARDLEETTNECPHGPSAQSMALNGSSVVQLTRRKNGLSKASKQSLSTSTTTSPQPLYFVDHNTETRFLRPLTLPQLSLCLRKFYLSPDAVNFAPVKILCGNTSIGVVKYLNGTEPFYLTESAKTMIDVSMVSEMTVNRFDPLTRMLTVGAAVCISELIDSLKTHANPCVGSPVSHEKDNAVIDYHSVFSITANHLLRVGNTQVRNAGTWAGNLMIYMQYKSFPSDVLLALVNADARLLVCRYDVESTDSQLSLSLPEFMRMSFEEFQQRRLFLIGLQIAETKVISNHVETHSHFGYVPPNLLSTQSHVQTIGETFKVAQREHNAHAYVSAACLFTVSSNGMSSPPRCESARIVFGGVGKTMFLANRVSAAMQNSLFTAETLSRALTALQEDIHAVGFNFGILGTTPQFLLTVAQSALYRFFLRALSEMHYPLPIALRTVLELWKKDASKGIEVYPVLRNHSVHNDLTTAAAMTANELSKLQSSAESLLTPSIDSSTKLWPVGRAVRKLEAPLQACGEAVYPSDEALPESGLQGQIVYSTQAAKRLIAIDTSQAKALSGVVAVFTAADIPTADFQLSTGLPLLFAESSVVPCVGSAVAIVIAIDEQIATRAATLVRITYGDGNGLSSLSSAARRSSTAITNLQEAIACQSFYELDPSMTTICNGDADTAMNVAPYRSSGRLTAGGQYHFYMETQSAFASWKENVLRVVCGTQDPTNYQVQIANALGLKNNQVVVECARTGGAFGGKLSGGMLVSTAAALSTKLLRRPVRVFNSRAWDMTMQGGREDWIADYQVGYTADGKITAVKYTFFIDAGCALNDTIGALEMGIIWADNAYYLPNYASQAIACFTNTPARTSMRAPGVVQTSLFTEMIMERVASELQLPLCTVQQQNLIRDGEVTIMNQPISDCTMSTIWNKLLHRGRFTERSAHIANYNARSLWRKKGIACTPVKYGIGWNGYNAGVRLSVRSADGSITLTHNGVEIGQGINTKAAQAVASALQVDLRLVRVERTSTAAVANGGCTGGSGTSEVVVQAVLNACKTLNDRLAPFKTGMTGTMTPTQWTALLQALPCDVSLNVEGWYSPQANPNNQVFQYFVYGACISEVELDVLSGQVHVLSSELLYDCGRSLNPSVDIGQIEGALIMGIGYLFQERVQYETGTGLLQTIGTWEYKPPMAQDIPTVLNVTLLADAFNKNGILGSKAVGEPAYMLSNSVYFAVKEAIRSARLDAGVSGFFDLPVPATVDIRQTAALVSPQRFAMPC